MRPAFLFAPVLLVLPLGGVFFQDPVPEEGDEEGQEETLEPAGSFANFYATERERLEAEIEGVWTLQFYEAPNAVFQQKNVQGMAVFLDGYLSLSITMQTYNEEFLGDGGQFYVQAGSHRYQFSEFLELQTASMMAYHNFDDESSITFEAAGVPREYAIDMDEEGLSFKMTRADGTALTWSRLNKTEFPEESVDYLNNARGKFGDGR